MFTYPILIAANVVVEVMVMAVVMMTALIIMVSYFFFMKGALRLLHHPPKLPVQEPTGKANILIKTSLGLQPKISHINIYLSSQINVIVLQGNIGYQC